MKHKKSHAYKTLSRMMSEVHRNTPSTVTRADVSGARKEGMLRAIAFSKARKAGVRVPKKKRK